MIKQILYLTMKVRTQVFFVKANWNIDLPEGDINVPIAESIKYSPSTAKPDKEH